MPKDKGLMLVILRYADELRKPESCFDNIKADAKSDAVKLAVNLIEEDKTAFTKSRGEAVTIIQELVPLLN